MLLLRERTLQLIRDIPEEIKTLAVYGDQLRIQQVLADFLLNIVRYAPSPDGWVEIHVHPRIKQISDGLTLLHAEFRYCGVFMLLFSLFLFSSKCLHMISNTSTKCLQEPQPNLNMTSIIEFFDLGRLISYNLSFPFELTNNLTSNLWVTEKKKNPYAF